MDTAKLRELAALEPADFAYHADAIRRNALEAADTIERLQNERDSWKEVADELGEAIARIHCRPTDVVGFDRGCFVGDGMTIPKSLVWLAGALILAYLLAQDSQYAASVDTLARDAHQAACE